jgi:CubicO group peptidase (beta-lactamase class C family)
VPVHGVQSAPWPPLPGRAPQRDAAFRALDRLSVLAKWHVVPAGVARFNNHQPEPGVAALVSCLRRLPREAPAGTRWNYSTGETNLVGILVSQATKRPLADYLSEKIWVPAGMEQQATWVLSKTGQEISGCCIQAATRHFARFGVFVLNGARAGAQAVAPDGWLADATTERIGIGQPGCGYGYLWWTCGNGSFTARGIFGQGLFIDPKRRLVIASNANWGGGASDPAAKAAREAFYSAVQAAIDAEAAPGP